MAALCDGVANDVERCLEGTKALFAMWFEEASRCDRMTDNNAGLLNCRLSFAVR